MTILLATRNLHKKEELDVLFPHWKLILPDEVGLASWDHEETADTFLGNSLGKAESLWNASQGRWPVLADDSGICVDALGGRPGVLSARFGLAETGRSLNDGEKIGLLLSFLQGVQNRSARFVCTLTLILGVHRVYTIEESWEGEIAHEPAGKNGFGYDPIFWVPQWAKTSAELSNEDKNALSHRYRAARRMAALAADLEIYP